MTARKLAVIDLETDPFKYGRVPAPFAAGFYDGQTFVKTWGDDCIAQMLAHLRDYKDELVIYAHNGGKFDYWYLAHAISSPLSFIDSRLVKARLYHHELRDSLKILPFRLAEYQKDKIDYRKMERSKRERYKNEIIDYLRGDCVYLYELIEQFRAQFGNVLTIGGAAMREIKARYEIEHITQTEDAELRPYFHGGRCEAFKIGEIKGDWKLYDVNSLYPHVMAEFQHPHGIIGSSAKHIPEYAPFYLAHIVAESAGALPVRTKTGLEFPHGIVESFCTMHEINAALELGLIKIREVKRCLIFEQTRNFREFVYHFNQMKMDAEKRGDKAMRLFAKLIMNNGYGKFAQNPERFREFELFDTAEACETNGYAIDGEIPMITPGLSRVIGEIPAQLRRDSYYNVATAASITGAARSVLMRALHSAKDAIYCDTDSIVCTKLNAPIDPLKLGHWKLETEFDTFFCGGKKLYAAARAGTFYACGSDGEKRPIKCASKGAPMKPEDIADVARGKAKTVPIEAPSLRIGESARFIERTITREDLRKARK